MTAPEFLPAVPPRVLAVLDAEVRGVVAVRWIMGN